MIEKEENVLGTFYRQVYVIGDNVTNIINLPCVRGVMKDKSGALAYQVDNVGPFASAVKGDYICEDKWGNWHVVRKGFEEKQRSVNAEITDICGYPVRVVVTRDNDTLAFSTESVYERTVDMTGFCEMIEKGLAGRAVFRGFVDDEYLFHDDRERFEEYIWTCFK